MNRIETKFKELKQAGRKGFIAYLTGGDPDQATSEADIRTAIECGIDILELGIPFSDATADGPTIQEASQRALAGGMTLERGLDLVSGIRAYSEIPIVLFGYANPFFRYGFERLCKDASSVGADGLLVVDIPFEQSEDLAPFAAREDLCLIPLVAPTTPADRAGMITEHARGFVYYVMVMGVTGARGELAADVEEHVMSLKERTQLPVAVGFGVSNGPQAARAARSAEAVVVGSALVKAARAGELAELVRDIRAGLDGLS